MDLTVTLHPQAQGLGVGLRLFATMIENAVRLSPPLTRIELLAWSGNAAAIRLYEELGFRAKGHARIRLADSRIEQEMPMARMADGAR